MYKRTRIVKLDKIVPIDTIVLQFDTAIRQQQQEIEYSKLKEFKSTIKFIYPLLTKLHIQQEIEEGDALFTVVFPSHELYQKSNYEYPARSILNGIPIEYHKNITQNDVRNWNENNELDVWRYFRIHGPSLKQHSLDSGIGLPIAITSGVVSVRCKCPEIKSGDLLFYHFPSLSTSPAVFEEAPITTLNLFAMDDTLAIFTMQVCEYWKLFRIRLAIEIIKRREHQRFETYFPIDELIMKSNIPGLTMAHLNNERDLYALIETHVKELRMILDTPFGVELWGVKDLRYIQNQIQCIQLLFVIAKYKWINTWKGNSVRFQLEPLQRAFPSILGTKTVDELHLIYNIYDTLVYCPGFINIWEEMLTSVYSSTIQFDMQLTSHYRTFAYMYPTLYKKKQGAITKEINERAMRFAAISQSFVKTGQMGEMHVFPSIDKIFPQ